MHRWLLATGLAWQAVSPEVVEHARAGLAAQQQGHLADAISEFRKASELAPQLPAAFVNLGAACLQNHQYPDAIPALKRALELNPDLVGAHQMLGYALLAQGYAAEAIPHLQQSQTMDALGIAQLKAGNLSDAVASLQAALKARPGDPDLLYYLGRASGLLSKNAFDALESGAPNAARAHQALAENLAALKRTGEAESEFKQAIATRSDAPGIHLELGRLYTSTSDWSKAEEQFRAECKLQPGDAEAAYDLGQTLLQQGKLPEARAELQRAQQLRPDMPETLYLLGKTASLQGDAAAAEQSWKTLLAQEGQSSLAAQAHFGLATLYRKQGRTAEAARETEEFRKLSGK